MPNILQLHEFYSCHRNLSSLTPRIKSYPLFMILSPVTGWIFHVKSICIYWCKITQVLKLSVCWVNTVKQLLTWIPCECFETFYGLEQLPLWLVESMKYFIVWLPSLIISWLIWWPSAVCSTFPVYITMSVIWMLEWETLTFTMKWNQ